MADAKIKVKDRVRVKEDHIHMVCGYQLKPFQFRPLVGIVKKIFKDGRVVVDFRQLDAPPRSDGIIYGERARVHVHFRRLINYHEDGFPITILERVQ